MIRYLAMGVLAAASLSHAVLITQHVDAHDNLYNTDWAGGTNPYASAIATPGALDARAVEFGGSAFNFATGGLLTIATGCAVDAGALCTSADGLPSEGDFRGLPVYSLIGIWSSSATVIDPLGSAFFIGSNASFSTPAGPSAYLFLAENDGVFGDNGGSGYDVSIDFTPTPSVPEPGALALMGLGLAGLGFVRRKIRK